MSKGTIEMPLTKPRILVPGLPSLDPSDMPSFVCVPRSYPTLLDLVVNQFSNAEEVDWVLCNTFYKLEEEVGEIIK
ncbi:hypothetical protein ACSBR1_002087 [Camellia fascicularis]